MPRLAADTAEELAIRQCTKCGAFLPPQEEGFCEACGMPYGPITSTMPRITADMVKAAQVHAAGVTGANPAVTKRANLIVALVIVVALILAAVLLVILLTSSP